MADDNLASTFEMERGAVNQYREEWKQWIDVNVPFGEAVCFGSASELPWVTLRSSYAPIIALQYPIGPGTANNIRSCLSSRDYHVGIDVGWHKRVLLDDILPRLTSIFGATTLNVDGPKLLHIDQFRTTSDHGTLLVLLPSVYEGGTLWVDHHAAAKTETHQFQFCARANGLKTHWVAFNPNGKNSIVDAKFGPLVSGHCFVLQYDLIGEPTSSKRERLMELPMGHEFVETCWKRFGTLYASPYECLGYIFEEHYADLKPSSLRGRDKSIYRLLERSFGFNTVYLAQLLPFVPRELIDIVGSYADYKYQLILRQITVDISGASGASCGNEDDIGGTVYNPPWFVLQESTSTNFVISTEESGMKNGLLLDFLTTRDNGYPDGDPVVLFNDPGPLFTKEFTKEFAKETDPKCDVDDRTPMGRDGSFFDMSYKHSAAILIPLPHPTQLTHDGVTRLLKLSKPKIP